MGQEAFQDGWRWDQGRMHRKTPAKRLSPRVVWSAAVRTQMRGRKVGFEDWQLMTERYPGWGASTPT